jgi:subtilisin family serine protease
MVKIASTLLIIAAQTAAAQVGVPNVRLPELPQPQLPAIDRTLTSAVGETDSTVLKDVRRLRLRDLVRRNRATLDVDRNGAPIVRGEVLVVSPSDVELNAALAAGFTVARTRVLDGLDARVVVLSAPKGLDTQRALLRLREVVPSATVDFNHIYTDSGSAEPAEVPAGHANAQVEQHGVDPDGRVRLGLVDSGVDVAHAVFEGAAIHQHGCAGSQVPAPHGTAVASLMIGRSPRFHGSAPDAELYTADVFCGLPTGGAADAIADAFGWLARERVAVINVSLVGPPNATLEAVVRLVVARGYLIVAAVGNDGPAAAPLYPASYPGVVGVTGVDTRHRVLVEAGRGPQVKFAAPGADMSAAKTSQTFEVVRGTSYAAPIVAGLLAVMLREPDKDAAARAVDELAHTAKDLGPVGIDPIYGYGLVGADLAPEPRLAGGPVR